MRIRVFAVRTLKEMLRDPLTLLFGAGFPVVLLLLLTAIQKNVPVELFAPENLTPGIAVFGFSFLTLFSATIIAKDRESAFYICLLRPQQALRPASDQQHSNLHRYGGGVGVVPEAGGW